MLLRYHNNHDVTTTRQKTKTDYPKLFDPALAAYMNLGPPPVTMSNPSAASPRAIS
jgi:hypothetical protein